MNYYKDFDNCLSSMIDSIKGVLYHRSNEIFERLDFYNDEIYLEPLIYSYLAQNDEKWLDSIIIGYENEKKEEINVFSNSYGVIYLPRIGYFITDKISSTFTLRIVSGEFLLFFYGEKLSYIFEPIVKLLNDVELVIHPHPLLESFFTNNSKVFNDEILSKVKNVHTNHLNKAFDILKCCNPEFYVLLMKSVKKVMLFNSETPNSFAVLAAHSMVFFNVNSWDNEMFFVDHFSHEGSHVIFNILTFKSKITLFKLPYVTTFAVASGKQEEHSTIYLRFHGLFTFIEIIKSLMAVIKSKKVSVAAVHEAKGRIGFQLKRFENSLKSFEGLDLFQQEGLIWFRYFESHYVEFEREIGYLRTSYDLSYQSYDFNSKVFNELNPASPPGK
ncbi:hypothetical protein [Pedobacter cryoconitis]|uniref:HEXXH motif-containing protein n=1 Tax=Pedobacter cryoconitis TaxID=188932 RepID=A0A327RTC3_9SPHI|nr:hypothetical protein [Pedobacter cryoconitis]RAJ19755.1 hypothetical protein LY11_05286 [Pedobacter cryoconitis]